MPEPHHTFQTRAQRSPSLQCIDTKDLWVLLRAGYILSEFLVRDSDVGLQTQLGSIKGDTNSDLGPLANLNAKRRSVCDEHRDLGSADMRVNEERITGTCVV